MEEIRQKGIEYLSPVINLIENPEVIRFVNDALEIYVKDIFFWIPSSSSGKHHADYSQGIGGLLKHTKATMMIAGELFTIHNIPDNYEDYILAALCLHDIEKPSKQHPIEAQFTLEPLQKDYPEIYKEVISLIRSHHGQWDHFGKFPKPTNPIQEFVHLCDYISSRKLFDVRLESSN